MSLSKVRARYLAAYKEMKIPCTVPQSIHRREVVAGTVPFELLSALVPHPQAGLAPSLDIRKRDCLNPEHSSIDELRREYRLAPRLAERSTALHCHI